MGRLSAAVIALQKERQRTTNQIEQIDAALAALGSLSGGGRRRAKRHTLSPAARRKIAAAQRARWAKVKAKKAA
jgi:hypothetical protein